MRPTASEPKADADKMPSRPVLHFITQQSWGVVAVRGSFNVNLLIEKPVVLHAEEARDLVAIAKDKNLVLLPALNYGYLEYLKNFNKQIHAKLDNIKDFSIEWGDPEGTHNFFADVKKADGGISFIQEVSSHLWIIIYRVLGVTGTKILDGSLDDQGTYNLNFDASGIPGKIKLSGRAPSRMRRFDVNFTDGTTSNIVFTNQPGIITDQDKQIDADPEWSTRKSPLVQEYEYFVESLARGKVEDIDFTAFIESVELTETANDMTDTTVFV